ncbi:MAG: DinB family protein [Chloroflexota bacterium]
MTFTADALKTLYGYNAALLNRQLEGMTHAHSLMQLPFEGNCLNWVVGHLISSRIRALELVGEQPVWTDAERARYRFGSAPIREDGPGVLPLETLCDTFNESQVRLLRGLDRSTPERLAEPSSFRGQTVGGSLAYFQFHEAHHIGQMTLLGPLAGFPGAWLT